MKSDSASAVERGTLFFLAAIILAGVIFIFIGLHAQNRRPAAESAAGRTRLGPISDAAVKVDQPARQKKSIYSSDASDSRMLPGAARLEGKKDAPTSGSQTRSTDSPEPILILLIIGVFGYIWVNADQFAITHESEKTRINLMPWPRKAKADGVFSLRQPKIR